MGRLAAAVMLIAGAAMLSGCSLLPEERGPLKPPLVQPAQAPVRTVEAEIGTIVRQISGAAHFVPTQIRYHQFRGGGGTVKSIDVRAGLTVKQGDVLAQLDIGDIDVELLQRKLEYERKKFALEDAKASGDRRQIQLAGLEFELAELLYEKARTKAESAVLRAETDGVVTFAAALQPGDRVQDGEVLAAVADPSKMRVALNGTGNEVMRDIRVGMEAEITYQGRKYKGKVVQTPSSAPPTDDEVLREEYSKTIYVEMEELPPDAEIGAMADLTIVAARRENTIVLPKRGVRTYFGRTYVQILDGERRREIDVETGLENATEVEILSGLEAGMKVILQ
jgi:macrolide-specific efflux system membrane fusion protein